MNAIVNPDTLVKGIKVLMVEDEFLIRLDMIDSIQRKFPDLSEILEAQDGHSATKQLTQQHIDVVVTDWEYPDGGGKQLIKHLRENYPAIRILVVTGARSPDIIKFCQDMGIEQLSKSPDHTEFLTKLATIFNSLQTASKPERKPPSGSRSGMHLV